MLDKPTLKTRTDSSITVKFVKISEGASQLSYSVIVTGVGSHNVHTNCDEIAEECIVSHLSPGRPYGITVKTCIAGTSVCSDPSEASTIKILPLGK